MMEVWSHVLDLFIGGSCWACASPGVALCRSCQDAIVVDPTVVNRDGVDAQIWSAARYEGVVQKILPAYKDESALTLTRTLGYLFAHSIAPAIRGPSATLVPVASNRQATRMRGFRPVDRLLREAQAWLKPATAIKRVLVSNASSDQGGMGRHGRCDNVRDAMRARPGRGRVILCDDVVTTGATLEASIRALQDAGYEVAAVAVLADSTKKLASR